MPSFHFFVWQILFYALVRIILSTINGFTYQRKKALFEPKTWNHYESVLSGDLETNNMLESHNRTWNSIVGHKSNVWSIQELFKKQEAEARRSFLSNVTGHDMHANSGRKQRSLDSRQRIKFVFEAFETMLPPTIKLYFHHCS